MGSSIDRYDDTVTESFFAIGVINKERFKNEKLTYTNLRCNSCSEWWIMLNLGDKKKVRCPWCGSKCKVEKA